MNRFIKTVLTIVIVVLFAFGGFLFWVKDKYVVPVIMYHHVEKIAQIRPNWVNPERFEWQLAYIKKHNYNVIPLSKLVDAIETNTPLPHNSVVLTFDDGYLDNYTAAFPLLKKYQFPATIFVPSDRVGEPGYLSKEQLLEMIAEGITIGSHGRGEGYLPDLTMADQINQILVSKKVLEKELGATVEFFAYPIGGFSEGIKEIVRESGYRAACATNRGYNRLNKDLFELKRVRFSDKDNKAYYLWAKLSGYYNLLRRTRKPY